MADHDQRLKSVVRECLAEAVEMTHPAWAAALDLAAPAWLEQEVFPDPPSGERREVDLVARVPVLGGGEALVHVEVEWRDSLTDLRERMPRYHHFLGFKLRVLDGLRYAEGGNLLGVAFIGLMHVPEEEKPVVKANALRRLAEAELTDIRRHLLMELVEAYMPLDGPLMQQYQELLVTKEYATVIKFEDTTYERAQRALVGKQLAKRFGPLSAVAEQRLAAYPSEKLEELGEALLTAGSLAELGLEDAT